MTAVEIEQTPIDVADDLTRAREVVADARSDGHVALVAHTTLLTIETLAQQVAAVEATIRTERDEWTDWVQRAVDLSAEVANDNDWCGVYDATMERLGLPPRQARETEIEWWTDVRFEGEVDDDKVVEVAGDDLPSDAANVEITQSAEVRFTYRVGGNITGVEDTCICDRVDTDTINNVLPSWASDYTIEDEGTVYCDNCG